jgi:ferritin-like metal-binding protein YciE
MKKMKSLDDLLIKELKDLYNAENQLVKALPKMAKAAGSEEVRAAFKEHLEETKGQVERLEQVFEMLDVPARGPKCKGMEGIVEEGKEIMENSADGPIDAGLIAAAQKVEHYEIAGYGTACAWAKQLGYDEPLKLLLETLNEEKKTDQLLTKLAKSAANPEAMR